MSGRYTLSVTTQSKFGIRRQYSMAKHACKTWPGSKQRQLSEDGKKINSRSCDYQRDQNSYTYELCSMKPISFNLA